MNRICILLILAAAVVGGCNPSPESAFVSEFSAEALIEKNLPEKATFMFVRSEDRSTVGIDSGRILWERRPLRLLDSTVECLISPADENEFMEALKTEVEGLIQSSGAEIQARSESTISYTVYGQVYETPPGSKSAAWDQSNQVGEARGGDPATLFKFKFGYITRKVRGFIWVRGVRGEGERYKIIILICEG